MKRSQLLLPPGTPAQCRIWISLPRGVDGRACADDSVNRFPTPKRSEQNPLIIANPDGGLVTYATAIPLLDHFCRKLTDPGILKDITGVIDGMRDAQAIETKLDASGGLEQAAQTNGDALAALRRISRESAASSTLIDRAARHLNVALTQLGHTHVVILNAERIDRPTLKVLARACLITSLDTKPPVWIWTEAALAAPVRFSTFDARTDLPLHARRGILSAIKAVLQPVEADLPMQRHMLVAPIKQQRPDYGIGGATGRLANLNYDGCAEWLSECSETDVDTCRLAALLMVNLGLYDAAIDALNHATAQRPAATLQCHIWYIAGLIWSKRRYNLDQSNLCFDRAEAALEHVTAGDPGDPHMERAWVQNGRAMNAILAARFAGKSVNDAFPVAFDHLRRAFDLVREGRTRDRVYLRYNLLGNMSNLMEIGGNYSVALDLLNRTFDESLARGSAHEREWLAQQGCLRAALMARSGDVAAAVPVFADARAFMIDSRRPIGAEALGRSEATARFQSGDIDGARRMFAECLDESRALRSRLGVETHSAGLAACAMAAGRPEDAIAALRNIGAEEDVWPVEKGALDCGDLSGLRIRDTYYGLPLSIPEVDLEDMAPASIAGALRGRQDEVATARKLER